MAVVLELVRQDYQRGEWDRVVSEGLVASA